MNKLILLVLIGITGISYSQSNLIWSEDFEVDNEHYFSDFPTIQHNSDTLMVVGTTNTMNGQRLQVINYDLLGDTLSTQIYGNDSVFNNLLIDYIIDGSDNIYILQKEEISFNKHKLVLQKYALDGSLIWVEQIQDAADTSFVPLSLGLSNDTCLFITAYKEYNYQQNPTDVTTSIYLSYLYAFNSDGNQLWQREFDPNDEVNWFVHDIFIHENTAFLFVNNYTASHSLIKVDVNNTLTTNLNTGLENGFNDVQLTPDNKLLILSGTKYRISKADLNGTLIWTKYYGTNLPSNVTGDEFKAAIQDADGNIYVTGRHYGDDYGTASYSNADILTIKYDSSGTIIWENRFEYGINNADIGNAITLKLGNVYVGGQSQGNGIGSNYDYIVLQMDSAIGDLTGGYLYNGPNNDEDIVSSLVVLANGDIALTGLSSVNQYYDWTTQLIGNLTVDVVELNNPSKKEVVKIVDLLGRETKYTPNQTLLYIYDDGTTEKVFRVD
ncbi:MAG: hypothetical protein ACJA1C_001679 [Crocinitomicaceae bacterium]|jgi:hypothetical protein